MDFILIEVFMPLTIEITFHPFWAHTGFMNLEHVLAEDVFIE
jgi:hypothetical protein